MNKKGQEEIIGESLKKIVTWGLIIFSSLVILYILVVKLIGGILNP